MSYLFINNQEIKNDSGNPIPISGTVTNVGGDIAVNNFPVTQAVSGTVALDATSLAALENTTVDINNFPSVQTIDGTVFLDSTNITSLQSVTASISNFPTTQAVSGTVALDSDTKAALETITVDTITNPVTVDTIANPIIVDTINNPVAVTGTFFQATQPISGTVSVNQPVAITDNDSSITVDGTVAINNFPSTQTVDGTVALDTASLAALETITVDAITNPVTIQDGGGTITVDGIMTPYLIGIAQGLISGTSSVNKFGYRASIPSSYQTIWDGTADYAYAAAGTVLAVADNTGSDNNGTVEVQGLDQNYALVTETLTIGGAASSNQFLRVFRARMITANTGTTNVDEVRIKRATTDLAIILAAAGQTLMSLYTIPAGKTGYLIRLQGNVDANNDALFRLISKPLNGSFNVKGQFGVFASGFTVDYPIPLVFTEKTDLQVVAKSQNNVGGGASFDLILKDN